MLQKNWRAQDVKKTLEKTLSKNSPVDCSEEVMDLAHLQVRENLQTKCMGQGPRFNP